MNQNITMMMKFDEVIAIIEKAMQLGYRIESEDRGITGYISITNNNCNYIDIHTDCIDNNSKFQIILSSIKHNGKLKFDISKSESLMFNLYVEKINNYRKAQLLRDIKDLFPEEDSKLTDINDLDDKED